MRKILDYFSPQNNKIGHIQLYNLQEIKGKAYGERGSSFTSEPRS